MAYRTSAIRASLLVVLFLLLGCAQGNGTENNAAVTRLVFKHGKTAGDPELFRHLLRRFEQKNPDIMIREEILPSSSDEQHQFYVINLESKSDDFDVLSMDIIWVPEFARAGWLREISHLMPEEEREDFFPGPMQAVTYQGKLFAIPWYTDAGLLYYRKDILKKYGFAPPQRWHELVDTAQFITEREPGLYGFIWQGKQYEGLVCNVLEYFWSNGGDVLHGESVVMNTRENREALQFMRDLVEKYNVTPPLVTTAIEEPTRHIFGNGGALFMRNWPYAWNIFERPGSPVQGKVGVTLLPSFPGKESASTLGGWQLGINRYSKHPEAAEKFIRFMTSPAIQKTLAVTVGYKPTRKVLYQDRDLVREQPFITGLYDVFMKARPRPVSPYYMMMTQVMQPEFSAALSGIKTPETALRSAQKQIEHILRSEQ